VRKDAAEPVPRDPPLTAKEAAAEAGLSRAAFWRACRAGRLPSPCYPLPRAPRWFASEIRAALLAHRMSGAEAVAARATARTRS
jgi:predicted DNA-binding transcriptional regulator AlpA